MQGSEFNRASLKSRSGKLYFGGIHGFTVFHPDSIQDNPIVPPVYLTNFQIFNKDVPIGTSDSPISQALDETSEIRLSHDQSVFSLEFAALNYSIPEKNQYAYYLENFEKDWNYVGNQRKATYTNLDPGEYIFHAKGSNNDGIWNEKGISIRIIITPPWWKTWWFRIVAFFLIAGLLVGYYQYRLVSVARQNQQLEELVNKRTHELKVANEELFSKQEEINTQNEELTSANDELMQRQEEIGLQRDLLAAQNQELIDIKKTVEAKNREITLQNETLDQQVKERTQELVEYNQQLEQFAFITAHNLRAPVARILGLGQLLTLANTSAEEEKLFMEKMVASAQDLDQVIKDLNDILTIQKNKTLPLTSVDLDQELELIKHNLEEEIINTQAQVIADFSRINTITTLKPYLDSILMNLIHNAIKYRSPSRIPFIKIQSELIDDYVCISVSDNGLGLDLKNYQDKLFGLYKRFHPNVMGKGVGLYLVKTQVTALGGKIEVESKVNQGTTFKVFLKMEG